MSYQYHLKHQQSILVLGQSKDPTLVTQQHSLARNIRPQHIIAREWPRLAVRSGWQDQPDPSKVFALDWRYGKEMCKRHAFYFASWDEESGMINLGIHSMFGESNNSSVMCSPIVDALIIKKLALTNLLDDGGFGVGPAVLKNSKEGVLREEEPDQLDSPLQQWSILRTVKYIDSRHYSVPEGKAAIELVSGHSSGILITLALTKGSTYTLRFMWGMVMTHVLALLLVFLIVTVV